MKNRWYTLHAKILFCVVIFSALFHAGIVWGSYYKAFGGPSVASAAVLVPGQYYDFQKTLEDQPDHVNYKYFFYQLRTPAGPCLVRWHIEQLNDYKTERGVLFSTGLPIVESDGLSGQRKYLKSPKHTIGEWERYDTGEIPTCLVMYNDCGTAEYRIWAEVEEDFMPETAEEISSSTVYNRSSVVSGSCPKLSNSYENDFFAFQTDENSVYKITFTVNDRYTDVSGEGSLRLYKDGQKSTYGASEETYKRYGWSEWQDMNLGTGSLSKKTTHTYYVQLTPNTKYQFGVSGKNCNYTISFGDVSLSEITETKDHVFCTYNLYIGRNYYDASVRHHYQDYNYFNRLDGLVYKGDELKPRIYLYYRPKDERGQDFISGEFRIPENEYTVNYKDNDEPGTAYVVVQGKNHLKGTFRASFIIKADPNSPAKGTKLKDKASNGKYKVTVKGAAVEYTAPISKKTTIKIPDTVTIDKIKYKVTSVASKALKGYKSTKKLTIGANVKKIGAEAFSGCTALTNITIPSKVNSIGQKAFYNCKKLNNITVKTNLLTEKNVGKNAFKGTAAKAKVKVPKEQLSAYKKLLKKKGLNTKASVKS